MDTVTVSQTKPGSLLAYRPQEYSPPAILQRSPLRLVLLRTRSILSLAEQALFPPHAEVSGASLLPSGHHPHASQRGASSATLQGFSRFLPGGQSIPHRRWEPVLCNFSRAGGWAVGGGCASTRHVLPLFVSCAIAACGLGQKDFTACCPKASPGK